VPAPGFVSGKRFEEHEAEPAVPLFVSLCDEVCLACRQRPEAARAGLKALKCLGVWGVAVNVWWSQVETRPEHYDWSAYMPAFDLAREAGLKVKVSMCFHGDEKHTLPHWVLQEGLDCPDVFYTDKSGNRCTEYLSLGVDSAPVLAGRTAIQTYEDLMRAFCAKFSSRMGSSITDIDIGLGPKGELRYPSIPVDQRWCFPGIGEFQCYDRFMLASLAACAHQAGQPHWGTSGPHDAGSYCQWPHQTGFFHHEGSWTSEYGHFFLQWYSAQLTGHADRVLAAANRALGGQGARLHARLPVIHWWYNQAAHAAELAAGWYNTAERDGYLPALQVLQQHGVQVQLSAGEMRDSEQPPAALSSPEHLLLQLRAGAAAMQIPVTLSNHGCGFDQNVLAELEHKAFENTCLMGVDIAPVAAVQFNSMSDAMFDSQHWPVFREWVARVRSRSEEVGSQQQRLSGSSSGSQQQQGAGGQRPNSLVHSPLLATPGDMGPTGSQLQTAVYV